MKKFSQLNAEDKTVFYRPDYNVPLLDGQILDDFRIQATYPTLDELIKQGARIVIGTHLGRPEGKAKPEFELRPVAEVLADHYSKQTIRLAHSLEVETSIAEMQAGDLLLLPNLRFYAGEERNDPKFAAQLASLAEVYVNDAFAADHRAHASIVGVPSLLPGYPGFLLEAELNHLSSLLRKPVSPFVVIMGGAKIKDKIGVIRALAKKADRILIGGAMANTFLLAKGEKVGNSLTDPEDLPLATSLQKELGDKLVLAVDYVKDEETEHFRYLDIGEKSIALFEEQLKGAKTIFWNGSLGQAEDPRFAKATEAIARYIGSLEEVHSVVAGGDTVETISKLKLHKHFSFISTGGGAALEFLAGAELPGVEILQ